MISGPNRFNIYLLLLCAALAGCQTTKDPEAQKKKLVATLRVHLEALKEARESNNEVPVFREKPVMVNISKEPFLDEGDVIEAKVVDGPGGFQLQIQFDRRGSWVLENYTTTNPGKHLAIFSQFGQGIKQHRWLGAPAITRRNSTGMLTFTPDASRQECEDIALGLNNVAKKLAQKNRW